MKEYKVEAQTFYSKLTLDAAERALLGCKEHIAKASSAWIQQRLDERARDGWRLASTDAASFGLAVYVYLYFERDAAA